jgi:hypothetical protein
MEAIMQKTALTIFGALLISGLAVQMATAAEHHGRKAYDRSDFRRAYNGPVDAAMQRLYPLAPSGFGFGGRDPSWVGGKDPSLNPSAN